MDNFYLLRALELAQIRRGFCAPNPSVGAVVVKNQEIISEGFHFACGKPHAEVEALKNLSTEVTAGATLYVTLEPCCHWGKTPPCTDIIIDKKIAKVVFGHRDPNPEVAKLSEKILTKANIASEYLPLPEIAKFYQSYDHRLLTGKPWVTAKLAISLDGKIALKDGKPATITGAEAKLFTHEQRKKTDIILTTAKTIHADDAKLNVRLGNEDIAKSVAIIDRQLALSPQATIFSTAENIIQYYDKKLSPPNSKQDKCQHIPIVSCDQGLDLEAILKDLGKHGFQDVWVEAGGILFSQLISQQLINQAYIYVSCKTLGHDAVPAFSHKELFAGAKEVKSFSLGADSCFEIFW